MLAGKRLRPACSAVSGSSRGRRPRCETLRCAIIAPSATGSSSPMKATPATSIPRARRASTDNSEWLIVPSACAPQGWRAGSTAQTGLRPADPRDRAPARRPRLRPPAGDRTAAGSTLYLRSERHRPALLRAGSRGLPGDRPPATLAHRGQAARPPRCLFPPQARPVRVSSRLRASACERPAANTVLPTSVSVPVTMNAQRHAFLPGCDGGQDSFDILPGQGGAQGKADAAGAVGTVGGRMGRAAMPCCQQVIAQRQRIGFAPTTSGHDLRCRAERVEAELLQSLAQLVAQRGKVRALCLHIRHEFQRGVHRAEHGGGGAVVKISPAHMLIR